MGPHASRCARERTSRQHETTARQSSGGITRGAAPVAWLCTRTERVQCLRIGCNARGSGVPRSQIRTCVEPGIPQREGKRHKLPYTQPGTWQANQGGDITRGAAPVTWCYTRTERVQCLRIGCNAHGSGVPRSQTRTCVEPGIPQRERRRPKRPYTQTRTRPQAAASRVVLRPLRGAAPVAWRYTRYVALHPLRGAAPVTWRYTRTERVQCPRIGCTALPDKNERGTWNPATRKKAS